MKLGKIRQSYGDKEFWRMSYDSRFLKWRMEQVWEQRGCVSPNHLANWSTFERGYRVYDKEKRMVLLWFKHGKRMVSTRGCRPKGKGFSFLMKDYQLYWRVLKGEICDTRAGTDKP